MSTAHVVAHISPANPFGVPFEPIGHAAQAIYVASGALLDEALKVQSTGEALQLYMVAKILRERVDAIATLALDRADTLCGGNG